MGHWIKFYKDGSRYIGDDVGVMRREKSWTKSLNENIIAVSLCHQDQMIHIEGLGKFWQSDTFEADMATGRSQLVARRIERQIQVPDGVILIHKDSNCLTATIQNNYVLDRPVWRQFIVMEDYIGEWLVLEMDILNNKLKYYFSKKKV